MYAHTVIDEDTTLRTINEAADGDRAIVARLNLDEELTIFFRTPSDLHRLIDTLNQLCDAVDAATELHELATS